MLPFKTIVVTCFNTLIVHLSVWKRKYFLTNEGPSIKKKNILLILVAQLVKNLPAMQEALVQFLGQEVSQEKG